MCVVLHAGTGRAKTATDPDALYGDRENTASATQAADIWAQRGADYEASWKLARVCYWLGTHLPGQARRAPLERGITAGETAVRLGPDRPEGHFWLAANMGGLAESSGILQGLKYKNRIKSELQSVIAIDAGWQGGSAEAALGQWFHEVPRLFGGSTSKAEEHFRRALSYDPENFLALLYLAEVLASNGHRGDARIMLQRLLDAPLSTDWAPEDREFKRRAAARLSSLADTP
jgi:hypothetical protein